LNCFPDVNHYFSQQVTTLYQAFMHGMQINEKGRCLGSRTGSSYNFIDYKEVFNKSHCISSAFVRILGLKTGKRRRDIIG